MANPLKKGPAGISPIEAVKAVFGECPEDVISPMETAAEAFGWLEELCGVIEDEAKKQRPCSVRMTRLAAAGKYLALDIGGYVDSRREQFRDAVQAADKGGAK